MKYIINILKRLCLGLVIIYGFNMIAQNFNLILPINIITVLLVSVLGFPALLSLILFLIIVF